MKRIIVLLAMTLYSCSLFAQKISNIDFDAIRKSMDNYAGYYPGLVNRFKEADTTLIKNEYQALYYGQCYQEGYRPYSNDPANFDQFKKYYEVEDFANALPYALKMIENNPLDMKMTFKTMVCYHYLKDEENKKKYSFRYNNIMSTIFDSGDGKSMATAFVVMSISDEYEIMANMEVSNSSQALRQGPEGPTDVMTLHNNEHGLKELFFNVTKPFQSLSKSLKGK